MVTVKHKKLLKPIRAKGLKEKVKKVLLVQRTTSQQKDPQLFKRVTGLTKDGQRHVAQQLVEETVMRRKQEGIEDALHVSSQKLVQQVLKGLAPVLETESVKRAGSMYQVPHPVTQKRAITLAVRQLREAAEKRASVGLKIREALLHERITAYEDMYVRMNEKPQSDSVNKRNRLHKEAKANRVFSHMRYH